MSQPNAPEDRATEFSAVDGSGEQFDGFTLMVEAYAIIWLILLVWLAFLWRKQAALTARLDGLESAIARAERKAAGKTATTATEAEGTVT